MTLHKELKEQGFPVDKTKASIQCKGFEDNSGAIKFATNHKSIREPSTLIAASTTSGPICTV